MNDRWIRWSISVWALFGIVAISLLGCATPMTAYSTREVKSQDAIVLVGVNSDIPFAEARYCTLFCTAWYTLGGRREILAFPANVGSTFEMNTILTLDDRIGPLNGNKLAISTPGIYYYGTIVSANSRVGINSAPDARLLLAARRKYGNRFDALQPINFTWPPSEAERELGLGYALSPTVQSALEVYGPRLVNVSSIKAPEKSDIGCRGGAILSLPDFLPYEEYIRRALNKELEAADMLDESPGAMALTGAVTELSFSSVGDAVWRMGLKLESAGSPPASVQTEFKFKAVWAAAQACPSVEDAVPGAVASLLELLVSTPEFQAMMSAAPTAKR